MIAAPAAVQQLRITLFCRYHFRERQNYPAARHAAAAIAEAHRIVVHRQNDRRNVRGVGVPVFRVYCNGIAAGYRLDARAVPIMQREVFFLRFGFEDFVISEEACNPCHD